MHGFAFKTENYVDYSEYRLVTLGNFQEGGNCFKYNDSKATYYGAEFPEKFILKSGDLIMPLTEQVIGLFGNSALVPEEIRFKFVLNQRVGKVEIIRDGIDLYYLHYLLATTSVKNQLEARASGTKQRNISPDDVYDVTIDLPDYSIQKRIGKLLHNIEMKQEINNKINAELESMAKTLYDSWFLQFEFPNEEGKPYKSSGGKMVYNKELKREIPKGWEVKKVGDILEGANKSKIQVNDANEKGKYPFFTSGESVLAFDEYLVDGFNIFLNTGGNPDIKAYMGKCAYSTDTWCVSAKEFSYVLYYYFLKLMPQFEQLFFAGSGLKHLQKDSLKNQYILLPDDKTLKRFNNTCVLNWKKTTNCLIVNQELTSLRDFLLPLLMNGQVTFKEES